MGAVGGLLGLGGGAAGTGFSKPDQANVVNAATPEQAAEQYKNAQAALQQQQQFLQATQAQNGLGNQSSVYNQLQGVTNGTGPNPAQAQLAQATGANVANQAALMAGQRGANANVGMLARQAAMQGANTQQQAAGQAATLQAQQSLNALNSQGALANQMAAQQAAATGANTQATQGEQGQILGAIGAQNNANVGMQSNINSANSSMANTAMKGQQDLIGGLLNFAEGGDVPSDPSNINPNSPIADDSKSKMDPKMLMQFLAAYGGRVPMAQGGQYDKSFQPMSNDQWDQMAAAPSQPMMQPVPVMAPQAPMVPSAPAKPSMQQAAPQDSHSNIYKGASKFGHFLANQLFGSSDKAQAPSDSPMQTESEYESDRMNAQKAMPGIPQPEQQTSMDFDPDKMYAAEGGKVPALVSPGEQYLPPKDVKKVVKEGKNPLEVGEKIPGKPKHPGNDYRNDVVKKDLDAGGMVIPNEVMQSPNPHISAMKFVHAHISKNRHASKKKAK